MKNKLLFTTALVAAAFVAGNTNAADYLVKDGDSLSQSIVDEKIGSNYIKPDSRVFFTGEKANVTLLDDVTMNAFTNMAAPTTLTGGKTLTIQGYLTAGAKGSDLSGIKLVMDKGKVYNSSGSSVEEGELVLANDLKVGYVEFKDGTGIWLHTGEDYDEDTKVLTIADGKTVTFGEGKTYVKGGDAETNEINITGNGKVKNDGILVLAKDTILDTDLENNGRIALSGKDTTLTANKKLSFDGTYEPGKFVGISSADVTEINGGDGSEGKLILNNGIDLKNGAGVWVGSLEINGGEVSLDGIMAEPNPSQDEWRAGSMLGANDAITVNGATVNVGEYGQFSAGSGGLTFTDSTINMNGSDEGPALLRAWDNGKLVIGADEGSSVLNVDGAATIAANETEISGTTINLNHDLKVVNEDNGEEAGALTLGEGNKIVTKVFDAENSANIIGDVTLASEVEVEAKFAAGIDSFDTSKFLEGAEGRDEKLKFADNNALFTYDAENGKYEKKNGAELAATTGATASQATALLAVTSGAESDNANFDKAAEAINDMFQTQGGERAALEEVDAMGADTAPVVRTTQTNIANQVFSAVASQLSGGSVASTSEGASSGDAFSGVKTWIRTLFNHGKHDSTSKTNGFDSDTYGVAFGADKQIDAKTKVGVGYAYNQTDIDSHRRDIDVDTHTAILYGEYKPSNWFVNGIATYNWSEYDEKKNVAGANADGKYDVDTIGLQAMTGYDMQVNGFNLTPEAGLRYVRIDQDGYTDNLGTKVGSNISDILTGVVGVKASKDFALDNGMNIRPEARLAATYDLMDDDNNAAVTLANGQGYVVDGEDLDRFGIEAGLGLAADVSDNWEVSAGYEGHYRSDYTDHTGMLNAKYKF